MWTTSSSDCSNRVPVSWRAATPPARSSAGPSTTVPSSGSLPVSLLLRALKGRLDDTHAPAALVDQAIEERALTGEELRDRARRLHPVALTDRGLGPALFAASTRAPVPVELDVPDERFPGEIERAAYDVVLGAIECAGDAGSHLQVSLAQQNGHVTLDVSGCADLGGDRLCALADHMETINGSLEVDGPVLRARFPVSAG